MSKLFKRIFGLELSSLCAVGLARHIRRSSVGRLGQKAAIHNGAPMTPRR